MKQNSVKHHAISRLQSYEMFFKQQNNLSKNDKFKILSIKKKVVSLPYERAIYKLYMV